MERGPCEEERALCQGKVSWEVRNLGRKTPWTSCCMGALLGIDTMCIPCSFLICFHHAMAETVAASTSRDCFLVLW